MNRMKAFIAGLALLLTGGTLMAIPAPMANPAIFGEWRLEMTVDFSIFAKGLVCSFTGNMSLSNTPSTKAAPADKIPTDPVSGNAEMQLTDGGCGPFLADISGGAAGNDIGFLMFVFPIPSPLKNEAWSADKGPVFVLSFQGELIDESLMEGNIFPAADPKGAIGVWRATRGGVVPAVTPLGVLLLLAGVGLLGGMALRRSR